MEVDVLTYKEGLYLATMGGAHALGLEVRAASIVMEWRRGLAGGCPYVAVALQNPSACSGGHVRGAGCRTLLLACVGRLRDPSACMCGPGCGTLLLAAGAMGGAGCWTAG